MATAYDYNKIKSAWEQMNDTQKKQYSQQYANNANFQQFQKDYAANNTVYTPTTTNNITTPSYTYGDTGGASQAKQYTGTGVSSAGDYTYNPNLKTNQLNGGGLTFGTRAESVESRTPGYLEQRNNAIANALYNEGKTDEQSIRNYLSTFDDYRNYDTLGQNNTVQAIMKRMGNIINTQGGKNITGDDLNSQLMSEIWNNYNNNKNGYSGLMGGGDYPTNFRDAVNNKLKTAYGINNLDEFKSKYPTQYDSLRQALSNVEGVWNNTNENERQMLDGVLQGIIGTGVGAGSDISKLNVLESSIMDKFQNPDQIKQDAQNIIKLQTEGKNIKEIASAMNMSEDQVQQLILLANGLDSKAGEYYQLKSDVAKDITEPYDTKIARLEEEKKIALDRANRNVERLKQDFDTNLERQKQQNDINAHNADFLAGQYGYGFSKRGIEGLNYTAQQAQNIIDDLTKNYDRNNQELADGISDIIRNWQWNNEDLTKASEEALTKAKNAFTSNMLAIQQQYGTVGLQAQQQLANNVQSFIQQAESIYDNALARQQQNLSNLITNVSNLNALSAQNIALRQAKIEQFQSEALNMNRSELQNLANQLGMDQAAYGDLINYQTQAIQNQLNGYAPGAGVMFQDEISSLLESGANGQEVLQWVMNQPEFQQMTAGSGSDNWAMSGGIMYNKSTGEYKDLNGNSWAKLNDNTLYNPTTGETMDISGMGGSLGSNGMFGFTNYTPISKEQLTDGLSSFMSKHPVNSKGGQCGAFVNDYLQSLGYDRLYTDPIDKKKAITNSDIPVAGSIAVMDSKTYPQYGHTAIIKDVQTVQEGKTMVELIESNWNDDEKVHTRRVNADKILGVFDPSKEVQGNTGTTMSSYDLNTATMRIGKMAYGKNISEGEGQRVEETLKQGMAAGKSTNQILYDILGMTITKNEDKATPFIDIMVQNSDADGLSAYNVQGFADFINKGQFEQAMNLVEQAVAKERGGDFAKDLAKYENGSKYAYTKGDEMIKAIENQTSKLGVVAGRITDKYSKLMGDKEFQKLKSSIVNYIADWRHEMLGSATTETELKMIDDLIPSITDNPSNTVAKIKEFQDYWLNKYNNTRGNLYLPTLTKETLLDKNLRVKLYDGSYIPTGSSVFTSGGGKKIQTGGRL